MTIATSLQNEIGKIIRKKLPKYTEGKALHIHLVLSFRRGDERKQENIHFLFYRPISWCTIFYNKTEPALKDHMAFYLKTDKDRLWECDIEEPISHFEWKNTQEGFVMTPEIKTAQLIPIEIDEKREITKEYLFEKGKLTMLTY